MQSSRVAECVPYQKDILRDPGTDAANERQRFVEEHAGVALQRPREHAFQVATDRLVVEQPCPQGAREAPDRGEHRANASPCGAMAGLLLAPSHFRATLATRRHDHAFKGAS